MTVETLRDVDVAAPTSLLIAADARRTRALLEVEPVLDEIERRAAIGLGAISSAAVLGALRQLPVDLPIPVTTVTPSVVKTLRLAPEGCYDVDGTSIIRRAVPAVRVVSAGVCTSTWGEGLRQASQFASYCSRYAVVSARAFDRDAAMIEARYYGIGLATMTGSADSFRWLVRPAPFCPTRQTAASWQFAETALEALALSPERARR